MLPKVYSVQNTIIISTYFPYSDPWKLNNFFLNWETPDSNLDYLKTVHKIRSTKTVYYKLILFSNVCNILSFLYLILSFSRIKTAFKKPIIKLVPITIN